MLNLAQCLAQKRVAFDDDEEPFFSVSLSGINKLDTVKVVRTDFNNSEVLWFIK